MKAETESAITGIKAAEMQTGENGYISTMTTTLREMKVQNNSTVKF